LPNKETTSKSDPYCITLLRPLSSSTWTEYHKTEVIKDDLNPKFANKPLLPISFTEKYYLMFKLFDYNKNSADRALGHIEVNVEELLSQGSVSIGICTCARIQHSSHRSTASLALSLQITLNLRKINMRSTEVTSTSSKIILTVEKLIDNNDDMNIQFSGLNIAKMDRSVWGTKKNSDPYLEISKRSQTNAYLMVYRTEVKSLANYASL